MFSKLHSRKRVSILQVCLIGALCLSNATYAGFYLREESRPMWAKADTNRDGFLSRQEICIEDPEMLREFDNADVNQDGKLDLGEFEILLISL